MGLIVSVAFIAVWWICWSPFMRFMGKHSISRFVWIVLTLFYLGAYTQDVYGGHRWWALLWIGFIALCLWAYPDAKRTDLKNKQERLERDRKERENL